jgi:hypothetical protein
MNQPYVGFTKKVERAKGWWLSIDDEVIEHPKGRVFDPMKHCFNPLKDLDYKRARELAKLFYTISPQGENTLTVRNGKRALLKALMKADRLSCLLFSKESFVSTGMNFHSRGRTQRFQRGSIGLRSEILTHSFSDCS